MGKKSTVEGDPQALYSQSLQARVTAEHLRAQAAQADMTNAREDQRRLAREAEKAESLANKLHDQADSSAGRRPFTDRAASAQISNRNERINSLVQENRGLKIFLAIALTVGCGATAIIGWVSLASK